MRDKISKFLPSPWINPTTITFVVSLLVIGTVILLNGGDPLVLARLGTQYSEGDAHGTQGYDGQFMYYIARNPDSSEVVDYLDVPAYRYQRILMPLMARLFSLGQLNWLPWAFVIIGVLSHTAGTWAVSTLLRKWRINSWYALLYGLYAGFLLALIVDLPETLAYAWVAAGILALQSKRLPLGWTFLTLAVFSKEVALVFVAAIALSYLLERRWIALLGISVMTFLPFSIFQGWLWVTFGQPGIGSGGDMATAFELIPFMGLLRIAAHSWIYLLAMLVVFGPTLLWSVVWGIWKSVQFLRAGDYNMLGLALLFNSLMILFLPFSTFRETGGLIRLTCGLVLAVLLFAAYYRQQRVLNYCRIWLVLNVFLLKS